MNRKERRNLQRQGVQVPKDPTLNIKLSALGKSIMTPEMQMAMMHEINQQCLEKDDLLALDVDCMVLWTLHRHLGFGVKRLHDFYLAMAAEHRRVLLFMKWMTCTRNGSSSRSWVQMSNNGKRRCWPMSPKPWENAEGYADPTAYNAIKKVSAEEHEALDAKVNTLIKVLKFIIAESGFELAARIELRDRKTGRFFR